MSKIPISIENPIPGGSAFTSPNRARRFVRDGRAIWTDSEQHAIRFVEHHACKSVELTAHEKLMLVTGKSYDHIRKSLSREELRGIPFVGNIELLMNRGKQGRTGPAQVA